MNDQLFNEIKQKHESELSVDFEKMRLRSKGNTYVVLGIIGAILFTQLTFMFSSLVLLLLGCFCIVLIIRGFTLKNQGKGGRDYHQQYYNTVVKDLLDTLYDDISCETENIKLEAKEAYNGSGFDRGYDVFSAYSAWSMKYGNHDLKIYDIHTQERHEDSDGNTTYVTTFKGLFGVMSLSHNFNNEIYINKKGRNYNKLEQVNMDSVVFNKEYKVLATDKVLAMQLLTHDVMDQILALAEANKGKKINYEFRIMNDKLYYRIFNYNTFTNGSKEAINRAELENDYNNVKLFIDILNIVEKSVYDNSINE